MKKKWIGIMTTLAMTASVLAGCGSDGGGGQTSVSEESRAGKRYRRVPRRPPLPRKRKLQFG